LNKILMYNFHCVQVSLSSEIYFWCNRYYNSMSVVVVIWRQIRSCGSTIWPEICKLVESAEKSIYRKIQKN